MNLYPPCIQDCFENALSCRCSSSVVALDSIVVFAEQMGRLGTDHC